MPKARQHILGERSARQHRAAEGRQISQNEIERFLTDYGRLDRVEGKLSQSGALPPPPLLFLFTGKEKEAKRKAANVSPKSVQAQNSL